MRRRVARQSACVHSHGFAEARKPFPRNPFESRTFGNRSCVSFQDGTVRGHEAPMERRIMFAIFFQNRKIAGRSFGAGPAARDGRFIDSLAVLQNPRSLRGKIDLAGDSGLCDGRRDRKTETG